MKAKEADEKIDLKKNASDDNSKKIDDINYNTMPTTANKQPSLQKEKSSTTV